MKKSILDKKIEKLLKKAFVEGKATDFTRVARSKLKITIEKVD